MSTTLRAVYDQWPTFNRRLIETVAKLTDEQVRLSPGTGRWPLWAVVGHLACQRVFWFCDFAGEPGVETTPFPNAAYNCPGDDDLESVLNAGQLVHALESTFAIIEHTLDTWTVESLADQIQRTWGDQTRVHSRGWVVQRAYAHDVAHITEVNETLWFAGLPQVDMWS